MSTNNSKRAKAIIKRAMKAKGIKSGALADMLGMEHQPFYNKLNRGTMSAEWLVDIADAMGCEVIFRDKATGDIIGL